MFYGEYGHSLDEKDRFILPAKFRSVCKKFDIASFFLTRGLDQCLFLFPPSQWKLQEQMFSSMSFTKKQSRSFNRLFFSGTVEVSSDSQGRVLIPKYLKDYAGIDKEIMILGVSNRIEIWDLNIWKQYYTQNQSDYEKIAEDLME